MAHLVGTKEATHESASGPRALRALAATSFADFHERPSMPPVDFATDPVRLISSHPERCGVRASTT
ncbi:MAG: hypothetical protein RAK25_06970, partial [TACK group archaeon]|nr:hypothetical protein [TACK group archaeon]